MTTLLFTQPIYSLSAFFLVSPSKKAHMLLRDKESRKTYQNKNED